ncbi:MAG: PfkB family carbohydrate kinase [Candidatus Nanohaloarchaea archaeon]
MEALVIGQMALDNYYDLDGEPIATVPGGTAFNSGMWLDHRGFDTEISGTMGKDFPQIQPLDFSRTVDTEASSPVTEVYLEKEGEETREYFPGNYSRAELETWGTFDLIYLTSGLGEYVEPFIESEAETKAFCPGPEPETLEIENVEACLDEADYIFMNSYEKQVLDERMETSIEELPGLKDVEQVIITDSWKVRTYGEENEEYEVDRIKDPLDTTGAGDAFSSTYLASRKQDKTHEEAIKKAMETARQIVDRKGAMPQNPIR